MDKRNVFSTIPPEILRALTPRQKETLARTLEQYFTAKHAIDIRGTLPLPFIPKRLYYVLLAGADRRKMTRAESAIQLSTIVLLILSFFLLSAFLGIVLLYLLKSALGINLFTTFSLGVV